ncbi:MAG: type II secretion system F family protein, partial [Xanthomonadales bacterium]|nr:type II secretion system F family protein [Xanthomonadales bacterium]
MGAWRYEALDAAGRTRSGTAEGDSPRQVRDWLRGQGLTPLDVQAATEAAPGALPGLSLRGRMPAAERALVLRQLATLLRAGIPLAEGLGALFEQVESVKFKAIVGEVRTAVNEGSSLADAL